MAELEAAADLVAEGRMTDAENIYDRLNSELAEIYKHISAMSGPEILKAITEMGTDGLLFGKVIQTGTRVLRNARLSNISAEQYLTNLCQEVGCEIPKNAKEVCGLIDKVKSSQVAPVISLDKLGTVWEHIKPTQPEYPNTKIPKSFELHI